MNKNPYKIRSSKIVYENNWMKVREDEITRPNGSDGVYAYIEPNDSVMIVAINERNEILLSRNFRYPIKEWAWEIPGGGTEKDETAIESAKRELAEEAGLASDDWQIIGQPIVCNGLSTERQFALLARNVYKIDQPKSDDEGLISDEQFFPFDAVKQMILRGEISDNQSIAAIYLAELYLENEKLGGDGGPSHNTL